ncbi:polyprenyl synthetase family protein [Paractinoplanes rishiriensis]|uniref:Geranylgeranyl pyrophosphate synthase n=1 Tax=Paractinoplanes rishiriensis TaxID=1050105 RepID=A0A919MQ18_9ACTN|nr:polyprenyl synthetase family protein [Actinoplanes rishiriensis]GIE95676.1 geranylgeranyl pyrophosphate synthase [Actinoplanes rishiriensis]
MTALRHRVDAALNTFLDRQGPKWPDGALDTVRSFVLAGGKRLRPAFCYWGWRAAGGEDCPEVVTAAAALEMFHAFALIHDDIIDSSDRRRGEPSLHRRFADVHTRQAWRGDPAAFGRNTALLCGDLCAAWAEQMFHECGLPAGRIQAAYGTFARMRTEVIGGQYLDLVSGAGDGSVAGALTVIRMKAARYTVTRPLQIGARLAGGSPALDAAFTAFGDPLGDAFQLRDDILGVFGDPATTGKSTLDDLREGKPTVMMALTREAATPAQKARLEALFGDPTLDRTGADELRTIIVATGALSQTEHMIATRAEAARAALAEIPLLPPVREALSALAAAAVSREH